MKDFAIPVHTRNGTKVLQRQRIFKNKKERIKAARTRTSLLFPGLLFLLIVSILFYVWTRIKVVQYGYEISAALRAKEIAAVAHNERAIEIATLRSAQRVEKRAREELKMSPPRKDQLVIIR
jgi:cell division protein FtsL